MATETTKSLLTPGPPDINTTITSLATYHTSTFYQNTVPFDGLNNGPPPKIGIVYPFGLNEAKARKLAFIGWCLASCTGFGTGIILCTQGDLVSVIGGVIVMLLSPIPAKIAKNKYGPAFIEGYVAPESLLDPVAKRRRLLKQEFYVYVILMIGLIAFGGWFIAIWIVADLIVTLVFGILHVIFGLLFIKGAMRVYKPAFVDGYLTLNDVIPGHLMGTREGLWFDADEEWIKVAKWKMVKRDELEITGVPIKVCKFDELREIGWECVEHGDGNKYGGFGNKGYLLLMHANKKGATDDNKVVVIKYAFKNGHYHDCDLEGVKSGYDVMKQVIMNVDDSWFENERVIDKKRMYNEQMVNDKRYKLGEDEVKLVFGK